MSVPFGKLSLEALMLPSFEPTRLPQLRAVLPCRRFLLALWSLRVCRLDLCIFCMLTAPGLLAKSSIWRHWLAVARFLGSPGVFELSVNKLVAAASGDSCASARLSIRATIFRHLLSRSLHCRHVSPSKKTVRWPAPFSQQKSCDHFGYPRQRRQ